jgi:uncharacterized membrane protein YqaE (UPF0057 family)
MNDYKIINKDNNKIKTNDIINFENNISRYLDTIRNQKNKFIILNNRIIYYYKVSNYNFTLYDLVKKEFPEYNKFFIICESRIIPLHTKLNDLFLSNSLSSRYDIIERQNGGGLIDMFTTIIKIGELFILIGEFIIWVFKFIPWLIRFVVWLITDLLNPIKLAMEFQKSLYVFVVSILKIPIDLIVGFFSLMINNLGDWMQGFWGWDQSNLNINDKNSKYFKAINKKKGKKCYITDGNTIPFSIILGTLICPPLGVFMDMGTSGWLNIIICCLLTLMFYIPGLVYALLIIYS